MKDTNWHRSKQLPTRVRMEARRVGGCAWSMARDDAEPNKTACGSEEQEPWVVSRNLCKRLVFFLAEIRPSGSLNRISFPDRVPAGAARREMLGAGTERSRFKGAPICGAA